MTLLPVEPIRITVPDQDAWIKEPLPETCQVPGCGERGEKGGHHVVRRSHTGRPVDFVAVDGVVLDNRVRLCFEHHCMVTDHRAWIRYKTGAGWEWWQEADPEDTMTRYFFVHPKSGRVFSRRSAIGGTHGRDRT